MQSKVTTFLAWLFYLLFPLLLVFVLTSFILAILEETFFEVKGENLFAKTIAEEADELIREIKESRLSRKRTPSNL